MLRVLLESNAKHLQFTQGSFVSLVAHAGLIGLAVVTTHGGHSLVRTDEVEQKVTYMIPVDHSITPPPQREELAWVNPGAEVGNGGIIPQKVDKEALKVAEAAGKGPEEGLPKQESEAVPEIPPAIQDSVATALDVDSAVTRFPESASPVYPAKLLDKKIEGGAYVQFIVDTTGLADLNSFRVISSTHPDFASAVKEALPLMRFHPAIMSSRKVRQLVEQPFMFKIIAPSPTTVTPVKKTPIP